MKASEAVAGITVGFVEGRASALESNWQSRNTRMDDMEKLYKLDFWEGDPSPNERRVNSPRANSVVEATRALLLTRRPVIQVTESVVRKVDQVTADRLEKHLYGCWHQMGLLFVIDDVEFNATGLGQGVARLVYNPETPVGELPLVAQSLDPRTYYNTPSALRPLQDSECVVSCDRTRRDIEAEWGSLEGFPEGALAHEDWLDEEVDYHDYWCTRLVEEGTEEEEEEEEALGTLGKLVEGFLGRVLKIGETEEEPEREGDKDREKNVYRRVVNCVVADGQMVKEPTILPGYERLPFFRWAGVRTPLEWEDSCLSATWAIAGGDRANSSQGLIATENELIGMRMRLVEQRAAMALVTDDDALGDLDFKPGAVNVASSPDFKLEWIVAPGEGPELGATLRQNQQLMEDSTMPSSMMGQYQAGASGIALSMITNPVLMRIASRQRDREEVLECMNEHILALTEEYAPAEGWAVYGRDEKEAELEERLEPDQIRGYRRNRVKLSAQLPKDAPAEALMLSSLTQGKMLSRRSGVERIQQVLDMPGQSPSDELKQILVESILFDDEEIRRTMGQRALEEYDAELAAALVAARQAEQAAMAGPPGQPPMAGPPGGLPGPPPGPLGQGPMAGMPPGTLPPQAVPPALPLEQMQAMEGGGPPGP